MPAAVAFARQSLDFRRVYSSGSDTLRALPGITGGGYDIDTPRPSDLIKVARRAGMKTTLAIPRSAREFLEKLRPGFRFDETLSVQDYPAERADVWGYGADQSTARPLVDQTLGWMREHKNERFLFWVFNFDQHNWRELNTEYVHGVANRLKVPDAGEQNWRYRVVAAGVDSQFKRLLHGLGKLGLARQDDRRVRGGPWRGARAGRVLGPLGLPLGEPGARAARDPDPGDETRPGEHAGFPRRRRTNPRAIHPGPARYAWISRGRSAHESASSATAAAPAAAHVGLLPGSAGAGRSDRARRAVEAGAVAGDRHARAVRPPGARPGCPERRRRAPAGYHGDAPDAGALAGVPADGPRRARRRSGPRETLSRTRSRLC